jgi:hypothetical protein
MAGKPKQNMVPHLCKCVYVNPSIRASAQAAKTDTAAIEQSAVPQRLSHSASWSHLQVPQFSTSTAWLPGASLPPSPLPNPLLLSTPILTEPLTKRKRTSSICDEDSPLSTTAPWTPASQPEFGEGLRKLLIAIPAPRNAVNNPQMMLFVQRWIPGAVVPDRRTLSGPQERAQ